MWFLINNYVKFIITEIIYIFNKHILYCIYITHTTYTRTHTRIHMHTYMLNILLRTSHNLSDKYCYFYSLSCFFLFITYYIYSFIVIYSYFYIFSEQKIDDIALLDLITDEELKVLIPFLEDRKKFQISNWLCTILQNI